MYCTHFSGEVFSFPDKSDSESDEDDTTNVTMATSDTFHSMAEIASCSYEARQVLLFELISYYREV